MAQAVRARVQPTQALAGLVALAFLAFGIVGFVRTGFGDFTGHDHMLLGFAINPLHNLIHVILGVVGVLLAMASATARLYGWVLFVAYGALVVWGLMLLGVTSNNPVSELGNPLNLNVADNWLHVGFAALGLMIAVLPARRKIVEEAPVVAEPVTEPVPAQHQPETVVATDRKAETVEDRDVVATDRDSETVESEPKPRRGLHRLSRLRDRSGSAH